jgi:DedD protein
MATRTDTPELAVDELRRRARRRLVGAVVLALAAAVALPLLFESEPKPIGDDVLIQIPPVDSGKFINPLSSSKAPDPKAKGSAANGRSAAQPPLSPPSGGTQLPASPTPKESVAGNETRAAGTSPVSAPGASGASATAPDSQAQTADTKTAQVGSKTEAASPAAAKSASESAAETKPAPTPTSGAEAPKPDAGYVVQIAAFSDRYGARSLTSKLKHGGFPGYTEAVTTDKGTLHRVRVGPYPSREAADAALAKLKAAGFSGMVARAG